MLSKSFKAACMQMYDNLDWPVAVQDLIQAAEYLSGTGSPKVCFEVTSVQDMPVAADNTLQVVTHVMHWSLAVDKRILWDVVHITHYMLVVRLR